MRAHHAAEIRRGISDAKAFVAKGRTISAGYIFFESRDDTLHGRSFLRTMRRLDKHGLYHYRRNTMTYADGTKTYVHRLYSTAPRSMHPDFRTCR